jgi:hypothetical protein
MKLPSNPLRIYLLHKYPGGSPIFPASFARGPIGAPITTVLGGPRTLARFRLRLASLEQKVIQGEDDGRV